MKTIIYNALIALLAFAGSLYAQEPKTYKITGIGAGDTLNIRSGPGTNFPVAAKLNNGATGIQIRGDSVTNGTDDWVPISFSGGNGWTRSKYLASASRDSTPAPSETKPQSDLPGTYVEWGTKGFGGDPVALVTIVLKPDGSFKYDNPWIKEYGSGSYKRAGALLELTFTQTRRDSDSIGKLASNQIWQVKLSKSDKGNTVLGTHGCDLEKQSSEAARNQKPGVVEFRKMVSESRLYDTKEIPSITFPYVGELTAFKRIHNEEKPQTLSPPKLSGKISDAAITYDGRTYPFRLIVKGFNPVDDGVVQGEETIMAFTDEHMILVSQKMLGTDAPGGLGMVVLIAALPPKTERVVLYCLTPQ